MSIVYQALSFETLSRARIVNSHIAMHHRSALIRPEHDAFSIINSQNHNN